MFHQSLLPHPRAPRGHSPSRPEDHQIRTTALVVAMSVINYLVFAALGMLLARNLSAESFGEYGAAIAVATLAVTVATLGLEKYGQRALVEFRIDGDWSHARGYVTFGVVWALLFGLVVAVLTGWLYERFGNLPNEPDHAFLGVMIFVPAIALFMFLVEVCSANAAFLGSTFTYRILVPLVILGTVAAWIGLDGSRFSATSATVAYGAAWVVGVVVVAALAFISTPRDTWSAATRMEPMTWLRSGAGYLTYSLVMTMLGMAPIVVLQSVRDDHPGVGRFTAAMQVGIFLVMATTASNRVFAPLLAGALAERDRPRAARLRRRRALFMGTLSAAFVLACLLFGKEIMSLYGPGYAASDVVLLLVALGGVFPALLGGTAWELQFRDRQRAVLICAIVGVAIGLGISAPLGAWYGPVGAAAGYLVMSALVYLPIQAIALKMRATDRAIAAASSTPSNPPNDSE